MDFTGRIHFTSGRTIRLMADADKFRLLPSETAINNETSAGRCSVSAHDEALDGDAGARDKA